ncbi:hypothetical protein CO251_05560 [Sulfobacillus sp. hq2]|nr:hypothetical protein CO251_05560 [Sulfobacillus sp. hq2]
MTGVDTMFAVCGQHLRERRRAMERSDTNAVGQAIKAYLQAHGLSLRKFATMTEIHVSTLSRLVNGKRRATAQQMRKLAPYVAIPKEEDGHDGESWQRLQEFFAVVSPDMEVSQWNHLNAHIKEILDTYETFARTIEGDNMIRTEFPKKMAQVAGIGPLVSEMERWFANYQTLPWAAPERTVMASGLLYFILSTDAIPDYMFPIGYLDDALAIHLVMQRLQQMAITHPSSDSP